MTDLSILGKFHPMVVHFPVALMLCGLFMELVRIKRKEDSLQPGIALILKLAAVGGLFSVLFGWLLAEQGDYAESAIDRHAMAGYVSAIGAVLSAYTYHRKSRFALIILIAACIAVSLAAHWGAMITHGSDYFSSTKHTVANESTHQQLLNRLTSGSDSLTQTELDQLSVHVRAIMAENCYRCHNSTKHKAGLILETEEGLVAGGESGSILGSMSSQDSEMMRRLTLPRDDEEAMPPEGKSLSESQLQLVEIWLDNGAPWADTILKLFPEAPLALDRPMVPIHPKYSHPIDQIVANYLKSHKRHRIKTVDDRRFIKRAYLDITGLLPSYAEVSEFIQDDHPEKRSRLINRLLSDDEKFAVHWMSFWNDLLRNDYSGTGFITGGRKQISPWLYASIRDNKPYTQMVRELVNPSPASDGFIRGIQWRGVVNASQRTELQAAQNVSQAFLGTNLKCASCHNSFVNNLTLEQAYGFANIFADSSLELYQCDKPTGKFTRPAFLYPELGEIVGDSVAERLSSLASLITKSENGRFYRTFVNRIWAKLFGRGIIGTVDDMDGLPWSETLLDWLASEFLESGSDIRYLLRMIITSETYQMESDTDQLPEVVASEHYVFRGPLPRRLQAEQAVDVLSQVLIPFYHGLAFSDVNDTLDPLWIWHREIEFDRTVLPKPGQRYLRHGFEVDHDSVAAELLVTADHKYTLYLDGDLLVQSDQWQDVAKIQIPNLQLGPHQFAAVVENDGTIPKPAGFLLLLKVIQPDGHVTWVQSDQSWKTLDSLPAGDWMENDFVDTSWTNAAAYGRLKSSHWGQPLGFTFDDREAEFEFARASLVKLDPLMKTLGRPVRENICTARDDEATLLQALTMTNGEFFNERITSAAARWIEKYPDSDELVHQLYQQLYLRPITRREERLIMQSWDDASHQENVTDLIWSMVLAPEFQFI